MFSCPVSLPGSILAGYENATPQRDRLFIKASSFKFIHKSMFPLAGGSRFLRLVENFMYRILVEIINKTHFVFVMYLFFVIERYLYKSLHVLWYFSPISDQLDLLFTQNVLPERH